MPLERLLHLTSWSSLQVCGLKQAIRLCAMATRGGNHREICVYVRTRPHMAEAYAQSHGGPPTRLLSLLLHRALQN